MASPIKIGVFVPNGAQLLDIATVDVLATMSREYLSQIPTLPASITASAPSVSIVYITTPSSMREASVPLTADMALKPTHAYTDDAVAPGTLQLVVVPGPDPQASFEPCALAWLKEQFETPGVDVLCVCTGIYLCAAAGIADGRQASGPRGLQDDLVKKFPRMNLVGDNHRWVRDGNFWSSGKLSLVGCDDWLTSRRHHEWERLDGSLRATKHPLE